MPATTIPFLLAEPPPVQNGAVASVRDFDPMDLIDHDIQVGWLSPTVIGFTGFATETEAAHAAWIAYRAVWNRISKRHGRRPMPIDTEPLTLHREGDRTMVRASGRDVARLIPPYDAERSTERWTAFELRFDPPMDELTARSKARFIYHTLRRAGVRWSLWSREARPNPDA